METPISSETNSIKNVEKDLQLRKIALGEIDKPLTGYASLDKPWLKYYTDENIQALCLI